MSVYNVPSDLTEGEILEALVAKNGLLFASGEKERSKVCRRFRNSRGNCDVVVRMAPATHRQLGEKKDKRVFLLFSAHPYKNRVQTLRCFKCFGYGNTDSKGSCKIAESAVDAEKETMWRPNAQAGPSASTACGQADIVVLQEPYLQNGYHSFIPRGATAKVCTLVAVSLQVFHLSRFDTEHLIALSVGSRQMSCGLIVLNSYFQYSSNHKILINQIDNVVLYNRHRKILLCADSNANSPLCFSKKEDYSGKLLC